MISYGKQYIDNNDIKAVNKVLKSNFLTQGPLIERFEKSLQNYFSCKYVNVVSNGTAALHLSVLALGIKRGDEILIEYSKKEIMDKINSYFGYKLIDEIKLQTFRSEINKNKEKKITGKFSRN